MDKNAEVTIPFGNEQTLNQDNNKWRRGYFSCFSNLGICASGFLPCITFHFLVKHLEKRGAISNALTLSILFAVCVIIPVCWWTFGNYFFGIIVQSSPLVQSYLVSGDKKILEDMTISTALLIIALGLFGLISFFALGMILPLILAVRFQVIKEKKIAPELIKEILMSWCCSFCALCQAAREYSGPNEDEFFTV